MPIYQYICSECGEFEHNKRMSDAELERCPKCGNKVKRVWSSGGVLWKCDGAYSKVNAI